MEALLQLSFGSLHIQTCMQWDSHHAISSKYTVIGTLHHRANTVCLNPKLLQQEEQHLQRVLTRCKYPVWALDRVKMKMKTLAQKEPREEQELQYRQPTTKSIYMGAILQRAK